MTMNLMQNFTTTDLTLIGLGLTLFNYSIYCLYTQTIPLGYKTIYLTDNMTDTNINLDNESVNSLNTTNTDTINISEHINQQMDQIAAILEAEGPSMYHLSNAELRERLLTILHGMCSEDGDLSDVTTLRQSVFDFIMRNDPGNSDWFGEINSWVNTVNTDSTSLSTINNQSFEKIDEHIETISSIIKDLKSHLTNNLVVPHINEQQISPLDTLQPNIYDLMNIIYDNPCIAYLVKTENHLRDLIVLHSLENETPRQDIDCLLHIFNQF
jgi:ABC-type antimicrobial peptide transport system permease subunit